MNNTLLLRLYFFIVSLLPLLSSAASLQVYPVNINFQPGENAQAIYVKNTGGDIINAQVRVYQWQQKENKDLLTETQTLIVSPPITSIPPGKQQLLRVILPGRSGNNEQAFRLIVDELPGSDRQKDENAVRFLLRYSLPVFVSGSADKPDLQRVTFRIAQQRLWIKNDNGQHIKLSNVALISGNKSYLLDKGLMGYVLPGSTMSWPLPEGIHSATSLTFSLNDNATISSVPVMDH